MIVHIDYKQNQKFVSQDDNFFSSFSGIEKVRIRSKDGLTTLCIKEIDDNLVIVNE